MNTLDTTSVGLFSDNSPTSSQSSSGSGPVHVWLVDDHAMLRNLIAETLERVGGIICTRQFGSPNALLSALASRIGPDVILLDVQMGEHNGVDAIPAIKSLARDTRVLMLTTSFDPEWHKRAMESGASDYLLKSYTPEHLAESICRSGELPVRRVPGRILRQRSAGRRCQQAGLGELDEPLAEARSAARSKASSLLGWLRKFARN
jgi:DNA-binding NarL/FixJ family response regulator